MSKLLKISLILLVFLSIFSFSFVYATSDDSNDESTNVIQEDASSKSSLSSLSPTSSSSITGVSPMNSYSQANLDLNNILCIILIAIGVLIILLAIAILIKLKK